MKGVRVISEIPCVLDIYDHSFTLLEHTSALIEWTIFKTADVH